MRKNPMVWDDVPEAQVLSPSEGLEDSDSALNLLGLPNGAGLLDGRTVRPDEDASSVVFQTLEEIEQALKRATAGETWRKRIDDMSAVDQEHLFDALGDGEVSMIFAGGAFGTSETHIHETVLPGIWIGRVLDDAHQPWATWIEVADVPRALRVVDAARPNAEIAVEDLTAPRGAMNVMSILAEIRERALAYQKGEPNHVMNFTLMPMSPADSAFLTQVLGEAGVQISSGGYGAAKVIMTGYQNVWAVQYLNGMGTVILDTIEIGDVPDAVLASTDDFEDSAERLHEINEAYRP